MNKSIAILKVWVLAALLILIVLLIVATSIAIFPSDIPGYHGVRRLVDTQYGVVCYYGYVWGSCTPLPTAAGGK